MEPLFIFIDTLPDVFKNRYGSALEKIQTGLFQKAASMGADILLLQGKNFTTARALYQEIAKQSKGRDLFIIDAYAGALCAQDCKEMAAYQKKHLYEVVFAENLPEGLLPVFISAEFIQDILPFIAENTPVSSNLKTLVDWEYKGIDVGVWLSPSRIIMERVSFLPKDRNSVEYLEKLCTISDFSIAQAEDFIHQNQALIHAYPHYCAVELCQDGSFIALETFQYLIQQLDELAPETVLSLGVYEEVFIHPRFSELLDSIHPERKVLVESPSLSLDAALCNKALSRPQTELILNYQGSIKEFIQSHFADAPKNLWVRLIRNKATEDFIPSFLKEFQFMHPRNIVAKADSFGDPSIKTVDLSPLNRHPCTALGRELTFMADGSLNLCRQAKGLVSGNILKQSLEELWKIQQAFYLKQYKTKDFNTCPLCKSCDDWWIFNF